MVVGIGQGRTTRRATDAEMEELALTAGQPVANFPQRVGMGQLREQHRHKMSPRGEALGVTLGAVLLDKTVENVPRDLLQELTKQTGDSYHGSTLRQCLATWLRIPWAGRRGLSQAFP